MSRYVTRLGSSGTAYSDTVSAAAVSASGQTISDSSPLTLLPPDPIQLAKGGSVNLAPFVTGGVPPYSNYAVDAGSLPANVTLSSAGLLAATGSATVALSGDITFGVDDSAAAATDLATVTLTPAATGTFGYVFGHAFPEGAVPSGQYVTTDDATKQANVLTTWPDGSARTAIIAGVAAFTNATPKAVVVRKTGTAPSGSNVAESAITSSGHTVSVALSSIGTVTLAPLVGVASGMARNSVGRIANRINGPLFSEFKYYSNVGSDAHLAVFLTVRIFADGKMWTRVTIENGWFNVAGPTSKSYTCTVTIDGATRYNAAVTQLHHQTWTQEYWHGTEPGIVPSHDRVYLRNTKLVPNYTGTPSAEQLAALTQTKNPIQVAQIPQAGMGTGGYHDWIGPFPIWDVCYLTSTDSRTYPGVIANAMAWGAFTTRYRDETTMYPVRPSAYSAMAIDSGGAWHDNGNAVTMTPAPSGTVPPEVFPSHCPAPPYLAALLTADEYYIEECQHHVMTTMMHISQSNRGVTGVRFWGQTRSVGWGLRSAAMATAVSSAGPMLDELKAMLATNYALMKADYVDVGGVRANNLGIAHIGAVVNTSSPYETGSGQWWDSSWMANFVTFAMGFASDLKLPLSAQGTADLLAVRNHCYKLPVGLLSDGTAGFCYRRGANSYGIPILSAENATTGPFYADWGASYAVYLSHFSLASGCAANGTLTQYGNDIDIDSGRFLESSEMIANVVAIAYAVDHAAPGASAAIARLQGSPTYTAYEPLWQGYPLWSIKPR